MPVFTNSLPVRDLRYRAMFVYFICAVFVACGPSANKPCILAKHPAPAVTTAPADTSITVLLFTGTGTSLCDVVAVQTILEANQLKYATANSPQLNGMDQSQLQGYRLLIIPGGNFIDMGKSLSTATALNIHNAVGNGLNYLGICAGGFLAANSGYYNSFNLTPGVKFGFYSAEEKGIQKAAVAVTTADGVTLDQYWENGPQLTGWGSVIGKYPDGTPAIVQGTSGNGWVVLSGIHAEAPEDWRGQINFTTPAATDNAYAATLIRAALNRVALPHY